MKAQRVFYWVFCLYLGIASLWAGLEDFAGRWTLNHAKSDVSAIAPGGYPSTTLEIKLEGTALSIRQTTSTSRSGEKVSERRWTTDGKECLNAGEGIKDLKSVCRLEGGHLAIVGEQEGVKASMTMSGGEMEQNSVEYFRYRSEEVLTLSPDGKELTIVRTIDSPDGKRTIKLVFDRA
jgi:hypothetical protein